jgi:hypothetical protein
MINLNDLKEIIPMLIIALSALVSLMIAVFQGKFRLPVFIFSLVAVLADLIYSGLND